MRTCLFAGLSSGEATTMISHPAPDTASDAVPIWKASPGHAAATSLLAGTGQSRHFVHDLWVPEIRSSAPVIRDVAADPALLATVDDRSPHRRVTGTCGVPCLLRHDLVLARACNVREATVATREHELAYAASWYSWIRPPSRSRRRSRSSRRTSPVACWSADGVWVSGGRWPSERYGRCSL